MAFLDNSGDIILDAVLTDAGRKRLAEGDGSFRITKYAFGDDEIDYANYSPTNNSGSAYYDLEILQTPVLEAFTNNTANMKSKLITLTNNNILYLPVMKLNQLKTEFYMNANVGSGSFVVTVDDVTSKKFNNDQNNNLGYYIDGTTPGAIISSDIRIDQGLDTAEISDSYRIDAELQENQYIVELDNRFGTITTGGPLALGGDNTPTAGIAHPFSFIDDDNIASYYLSTGDFVRNTDTAPTDPNDNDTKPQDRCVAGPPGTHVVFRIRASTNLRTSTYLFERLGSSFAINSDTYYYLDTIVRVTGATTGYKIDIPVRFIKCKSCT